MDIMGYISQNYGALLPCFAFGVLCGTIFGYSRGTDHTTERYEKEKQAQGETAP